MSVIVQCEACGQMYRMQAGLTEWPNCIACQGALREVEPELAPLQSTEDLDLQSVDLGRDDLGRTALPSQYSLSRPGSRFSPTAKLLILAGCCGTGLLLVSSALIGLAIWASAPVPPEPQLADTINFTPSFQSVASSAPPVGPETKAPAVAPPLPAVAPPLPQGQFPPPPRENEQVNPNQIPPRSGLPPPPPTMRPIRPIQPVWTVTADPPVVEVHPVRAARLAFVAPAPILRVIRPSAPSLYFAALIPLRNAIVIGNVTTGGPGAQITPAFSFHKEVGALSADGKNLALAAQIGNHTEVKILDTQTGAVLQTIPFEPGRRVASLFFAGTENIVVGEAGNNSRAIPSIGVWNFLTAERVSLISLPPPIPDKYNPQHYDVGRLAVSPGGKFVACVFRQKVSLYDIATGKLAGDLFGSQQPNNADVVFTFSPDGSELAVMGGGQIEGSQLWRFELNTGKNIS